MSKLFAHHIERHQMEQLKECWSQFDVEKDGVLTLSQFKNVMKEYDHGMGTDIDAMFGSLQWSDSKQIRFTDLLTAFSYQRLVAVDERLWEAFATLDVDGDMKITTEQIKQVLRQFDDEKDSLFDDVISRKMTVYVENAIEDAVGNGDGMIDFEEFLNALHPRYTEQNSQSTDSGDSGSSKGNTPLFEEYKSHKKEAQSGDSYACQTPTDQK